MEHSVVRRRVLPAGVAVALIYVVAAAISGSLSPLARRPLLDGVHSAPPYNWVQQPPDEQGSGKPPVTADEKVAMTATGNPQTIVATGDQQVNLNLPANAVPANGKKTLEVKIEPLNPDQYGPPPEGFELRGNVYRVALRTTPGGAGVSTVAVPGQIALTYPSPTERLLKATHDVLFSTDGKVWRELGATDQHATQQVSAPFTDIGYYATAAKTPSEDKAKKGGSFPWWILIVVVVAAAIVFAMVTRVRKRRAEAQRKAEIRRQLTRQSRSTKKKRRR